MVPEQLNINLKDLILVTNKIKSITVTSLANYPNLTHLNVRGNKIRYIDDGSFDQNSKLQTLSLSDNRLQYLPADFGPAQNSIIEIRCWKCMGIESMYINWSQFPVMKVLNLGGNPLKILDASNLPKNLGELTLSEALLGVMPNLAAHAPSITSVKIRKNNLTHVPVQSVLGLRQLKEFDIRDNKLETIPDLYDQPLEKLRLDDNPLRCNELLCWVRLWARTKAVVLTGIDSTICRSPSYFGGQTLVAVDPVQMGCYKGECGWVWMLP